MPDEQDDLAPLMRVLGGPYTCADFCGPNLCFFARIRRKAEQYGAWQRMVGLNRHPLRVIDAARAAYFEDATATEAAE